jgi:cytochrome c-type biogenesis protein CcsB
MLTLGFIFTIFYKKSTFAKTARKLRESGLFAILLLVGLSQINVNAMTIDEYAKNSKAVSTEFAKILVQYNGRVKPLDSLDLDFIHKISTTAKLNGMDYNQIVAGMISHPEIFEKFPMIYIGMPSVRKELGIKGKYASYLDFFDDMGQFKYMKEINLAMQTPDSQRTQIQREWLKLNERIYVAFVIYSGKVFSLFPTADSKANNDKWYNIAELNKLEPITSRYYFNLFKSLVNGLGTFNLNEVKEVHKKLYEIQKMYTPDIIPSKVKMEMEIKYNHLQIFPSLIGIYSTLGLIAILTGFFEVLKKQKLKKTEITLIGFGWLALLVHTSNMILRWYISGHAPWSDAYESIVFIAWGSAFASLMFFKRSMLALGAGLFMAGMFMMVAHLNNIDPQITNMVPVLKSYWLLIHVAVITSSYGFLAVGGMLGFLNIILFAFKNKFDLEFQIKEINNIIYLALYIGLAMLLVGTFLGGVWANESWGRYWSWDPKETWSLISIVAYAIIIHTKFIPKMRGAFIFSLLAFMSFFFVLMTYFGVNFYIAQGLHAYGRGQGDATWFVVLKYGLGIWFMIIVAILIISITHKKAYKCIE